MTTIEQENTVSATRSRAEINRENALKSTGPKTEEGKQSSAMNATRHNLTGQILVLPAEDLAAYAKFQGDFHKFHKPVGPVETQCVQFMVDAAWQMNRARAWQDQILSLLANNAGDHLAAGNNPQLNAALAIAEAVAQCTKELSNLSLYEQRHLRKFERSHDRLLMLQEKRQKQEAEQMAQAELLLKLHEQEQAQVQQEAQQANAPVPEFQPYDPAPDGFVFSNAAIKESIRRATRRCEASHLQNTMAQAA